MLRKGRGVQSVVYLSPKMSLFRSVVMPYTFQETKFPKQCLLGFCSVTHRVTRGLRGGGRINYTLDECLVIVVGLLTPHTPFLLLLNYFFLLICETHQLL